MDNGKSKDYSHYKKYFYNKNNDFAHSGNLMLHNSPVLGS